MPFNSRMPECLHTQLKRIALLFYSDPFFTFVDRVTSAMKQKGKQIFFIHVG